MAKVNIKKLNKTTFENCESDFFIYLDELCINRRNPYHLQFFEGNSSPSFSNEGNALRLRDLEILQVSHDSEVLSVKDVNITYNIDMVGTK